MEKRNSSVLSLLMYCFSTTLAAALGLGALLAGATFAVGPALEASASDLTSVSNSQTFSGVITDSRCGARHQQNSAKSPAECAQSCVRHGAKYVLVEGDTIYVLAGNTVAFEGLAGQRARIVGTLDGDALNVSAATVQ